MKAGYPLTVYDLSKERVEALTAVGAKAAGSIGEIGRTFRTVLTMMPDSPQVREVVLGAGGLAETLQPGSVVIDMSSIAPMASREAAALKAKGIDMPDAPVSGGKPKAIDGTLAFMVGGDRATFDEHLPLLRAMGASVTY